MYYHLDKGWVPCGWRKLPFALQSIISGLALFFSREAYSFLLQCDGEKDLSLPDGNEGIRNELSRLIEMGVLLGEDIPHPVPLAPYRLYPAEYRRNVHWSITGHCNYRCRHCFMSAPEARFPQPSWDQLMDIVDQLESCGIRRVSLTGGEPLIREDFLRLVQVLCERRILITVIFTNGKLVTRELLETLRNNHVPCSFQFSFDGTDGWHDWMRNVPGASDELDRALRLCREYGFRVSCAMCLHKKSAHVLRDSIQYLASVGVSSVKVNAATFEGDWKRYPDYHLQPGELFRCFLDYLPYYFEDDCPVVLTLDGFFFYDGKAARYKDYFTRDTGIPTNQSLICGGTRINFFIGADGTVVPCMGMAGNPVSKKFPNIFETKLSDILTDSYLLEVGNYTFQDMLDHNPECRECPHQNICKGGCRSRACADLYDDYLVPEAETCVFHREGWKEKIESVCRQPFEEYKKRKGI